MLLETKCQQNSESVVKVNMDFKINILHCVIGRSADLLSEAGSLRLFHKSTSIIAEIFILKTILMY